MDLLNSPTVKIVILALAAANSAVLIAPGVPPIVVTICSILSAVFVALGAGSVRAANVQLKGARSELRAVLGGKS
jgi:hypothetical protein